MCGHFFHFILVGVVGFEPTTFPAQRGRSSQTELHSDIKVYQALIPILYFFNNIY